MLYKIISIVVVPFLLIVTAIIVIAYARGYRFDVTNPGSVSSTGILVATSEPDGAQVYVDGVFSGATNSNISLDPGWYDVVIARDGYHDWKRKMRVQGEIVVKTGATLFLKNPSLSPLTATSVTDPIMSPDGTRIAYIASPSATVNRGQSIFESALEAPTLFIYDLTGRSLPFSRNPQPYVGTRAELLEEWALDQEISRDVSLRSMPPAFAEVATSSMRIISFSPDDEKVIYEATSSAILKRVIDPPLVGARTSEEERDLTIGSFYVYDSKEDRNYNITSALGDRVDTLTKKLEAREYIQRAFIEYVQAQAVLESSESATLPEKGVIAEISEKDLEVLFDPLPVFWFGTSSHIVLVGDAAIAIMEYDGDNKVAVYSGPYENGYVFPHPSGYQIITMTSLNAQGGQNASLYTLNVR